MKRFNLAPDNNKKDTKEKRVEKFLSFAKNKNKNLKQLNDNSPNNEYLNEILLSVFEIYINTYLIEIKENIYNNELALKFFEKSVKSLINDELNENILINLEKLYSIAYVKCYLIKIIDIIYNNQKKDENEKENLKLTKIKDILINSGDFPIINVIKIFILKCFRYKMNNNKEFNVFNWEEIGLNWADNYIQKDKNLISSLEFLNLNINSKNLNEIYNKISLDKNIKFKKVNNEKLYLDLIKNDFFEY